jgi:mono/diheme cytochrome c family protein
MSQPIRNSQYCQSLPAVHRFAGRRAVEMTLAYAMVFCFSMPCFSQASTAGEEAAASAGAEPASADAPKAEQPPVTTKTGGERRTINFLGDIQPIFARHCLKCHGPEKRSGGLRLDARNFAGSGGDSGKPILSGDPGTNELLARVTASDRSYRMPKNAPPLSEQEIADIKQWVGEGCRWPNANKPADNSLPEPFYDNWLRMAGKFTDQHKSELEFVRPFAVAFVAIQLTILAIGRAKAAYQQNRPWTTGRAARLCRYLSELTARELAMMWLLSIVAGALVLFVARDRKMRADLAMAQASRARAESPWSRSPFGNPPVPIRPDHPKQVAGTYYRGNCERNPGLFNGGNYLTAIFRVSVCDSKHQSVQVGDPLPSDGLFVRMDIERAPGTTDALYSKEMMESVFLSQQFFEANETEVKEPIVRLETLEAGRRWVAYFPVLLTNGNLKAQGLIYVYTGRVDGDKARGTIHNAIQYALCFDEGKVAAESELWMGSFGNDAVEVPQPPGKIPFHEWFDYHPMPIIEGENSKDPKLLGIEQYEREGLITPSAKSPEKQPPSKEAAPQKDE